MKQKSLMVPEELQKKIKIHCAKKGISIVSFIKTVTEKEINKK